MSQRREVTKRQGVIWGTLFGSLGVGLVAAVAMTDWFSYWGVGPIELDTILFVAGTMIAVGGGYMALAANDPRVRRMVPVPAYLWWLVRGIDKIMPGPSQPAGTRASRAAKRAAEAPPSSTTTPRPKSAKPRSAMPARAPAAPSTGLDADKTDVRDLFG